MKKREVLIEETGKRHILYYWIIPFLIGFACFMLTLAISKLKSMEILELRSYDFRMRNALHLFPGREEEKRRGALQKELAIIEIGEDYVRESREPDILLVPEFTKILKSLHEGGASVIGLDYLISKTPDDFLRYGSDTILQRIPGMDEKLKTELAGILTRGLSPPLDCELGATIQDTNSVLACWIEKESNRYLMPNKEIFAFAGAENTGSANIPYDIDGGVRRIATHYTDARGTTFFTLSFLIAARYLGREKELGSGAFFKDMPFLSDRDILINYAGPVRTFNYFPFREVYRHALGRDTAYFKNNFSGKIVLIGPTDTGSQDLKMTPWNNQKAIFPGVEIHANAIATILHGDYIRRMSPAASLAILFLITMIYFFIGFRLTLPKSLILAFSLSIVYLVITCAAFSSINLWMSLVTPLSAIALVLFSSYIYRFIIVEREKRWLKKALGRYVSEPVAAEIMRNPSMVRLGGEEREISVLFSDINHFTTISESRTPAEIMSALNDYFTLMEEIVFKFGGTLKQFVGDEIMVIFGAPQAQKDHRKRAVETALAWREAIIRWREEREQEGKFHFDMKIGIHCGKVVVGNVGSPHRTEYAAVGDTVNTASRIMGLNKKLGTATLISEEIYEDVRDIVEAEDRGTHEVKGKGQLVHIFSITGLKNPDKASSASIKGSSSQ